MKKMQSLLIQKTQFTFNKHMKKLCLKILNSKKKNVFHMKILVEEKNIQHKLNTYKKFDFESSEVICFLFC